MDMFEKRIEKVKKNKKKNHMMKRIYLLSLLLGWVVGLSAQSSIVTKTLTPINSSIPVVAQENVQGGFHQVASLALRDNLSAGMKEDGMLVWVTDSSRIYQWNASSSSWGQVNFMRTWADGIVYHKGDLFLYDRTLVQAKTSGIILPTLDPTFDATNWTVLESITPLNMLRPATGDNSIPNGDYAQSWNWNLSTTLNPLTIASSSLTTGHLFTLTNSNASQRGTVLTVNSNAQAPDSGIVRYNFAGVHTGNGLQIADSTTSGTAVGIRVHALTTGNGIQVTGGPSLTSGSLIAASAAVSSATTKGLVNIVNTADSTSGKVLTIQANKRPGSGVTVLANGHVGIGTATPGSALDMKGTLRLNGDSSGYVAIHAADTTASYQLTLPDTAAITAAPITNDGKGKLFWGLVIPTWLRSSVYREGTIVYEPIEQSVYRADTAIVAGTDITNKHWIFLCSGTVTSAGWTATNDPTGVVYNTANKGTLAKDIGGTTETFNLPTSVIGTSTGTISSAYGVVMQGGGILTQSGKVVGYNATINSGTLILTNTGNNLNNIHTINTSGVLTISGAGTLSSSGTCSAQIVNNGIFDWESSASTTLSGNISGDTGALILNNSSSTMTLMGVNTNSGPITVTAGKLYIGDGTSNTPVISGNSAVSIASGATVRWNDVKGANQTISNTISGAGRLQFYGGNLPYNGTDYYTVTGNLSGFSGIVDLDHTLLYVASVSGYPASSATINIGTNSQIFNKISGATLGSTINVNDNSGWWWDSSTSTSLGAIRSDVAFTLAGNVVLNQISAPAGSGGNSTVGTYTNNTPITFSGVLSGPGWFKTDKSNQTAYCTAILTGQNTFTGPIELGKGGSILQIAGAGTLGLGSYTGAITNAGTFKYSSTSDQTLLGNIIGAGALTKDTGTGTLTLMGNNLYTGITTCNAGLLSFQGTGNILTGAMSIGASGVVNVDNAGVLKGGNYSAAIANAGALNWNSSASSILSGVISGAGALTLNNSNATLTLMAADTYTGATTVTAGNLNIGDGTSNIPVISGTSPVSIASGATMNFNNSINTSSQVIANTISGAGTLNFMGNNSSSNGSHSTYTINGDLSGFSGVLNFNLARLYIAGGNSGTGIVNLNPSATLVSGISSFNNPINISDNAGWTDNAWPKAAIVCSNACTYGGNVTLNQTSGNTIEGGGGAQQTATFSGVISGNGSWYQDMYNGGSYYQSTNVTLTGQNTFTGGITLGMGNSILQIAGSGSLGLGSYTGTITNAGTFKYSSTSAQTLLGTISGAGSLVKDTGTGTLTLSGNNTYSGTTTCNAGLLSFQGGNALTGAMSIGASGVVNVDGTGVLNNPTYSGAIANAGSLNWNSSINSTLGGVISGAGILNKNGGSSVLTLAANESFAGTLNVNSGTVKFGTATDGSAGGGLYNVTGVTVAAGALLECIGAGYNQIAYNSACNLDILGTMKFDNVSGYTWNAASTKLESGTILLPASGDGSYGKMYINASKTITATGSSFIIGAGVNGAGTYGIGFNGTTLTLNVPSSSDVLTVGCNIFNGTGTGSISKIGAGTLILNGTNTYTGATTISAGTVKCGSASALGTASAVINNSTLDMNGNSLIIGSLAGTTATALVTNTTGTAVALTTNTGAATYAGIIENGSATTALTTSGTSSFTLAGANTYTGATTVAAGSTLSIGAGGSVGSITNGTAGTAIANAGTLIYNNTAGATWANTLTGAGAFKVNGGALVLTGTSNTLSTGIITIASGATLQTAGAGGLNTSPTGFTGAIADNGTFNWTSSQSPTLNGVISGTGALTLNNSSTTLILKGVNTYTGATTVTAGNLYIGDGSSNTPAISGSSAVSIASGATMNFDNSVTTGNQVVTNKFSGAGTLNFLGLNDASTNIRYSDYNISGDLSGFSGIINGNQARLNFLAGSNSGTGTINLGVSAALISGISSFNNPINISASAGWTDATGWPNAAIVGVNACTFGGNVTLNQTTGNTIECGGGSFTETFSGVISGGGNWNQDMVTGANCGQTVVNFTNNNTFTGMIDIHYVSSVLRIAGAGTLGSGNYANNITTTGTFQYSSTSAQTLSGSIIGTGALYKDTGTGTLSLTGNNTYTGSTTCNAGYLSFQGAGNALTGPMNIGAAGVVNVDGTGVLNGTNYGGAIANAGSLNWNSSASSTTLSGVISGAGILNMNGNNTLALTANESFAGTLNVNSGTVKFGTATDGTSGGGLYNVTGVTVTAGALLECIGAANNQIAYNSACNLDILGTMKFDNTYAHTWNAASTKLESGTILLPASGNASYGGMFIQVSKTITATGSSFIIGAGVNGAGTYGIGFQNSTLTFNVPSSSDVLTVGCNIFNGLATGYVVKTGAGTLLLNGTNTYTGNTPINAGALGGTGTSTSSTHMVAAGAAIFGGTGTGCAGTYSTGVLVFSASGALLNVYSTGTASSCSKVSCTTVTAAAAFKIVFVDSVPAGTYTVLTASGTKSITGTPVVTPPSGRTVSAQGWIGNNYVVTLT